jgi:HD-like signal output (HDOD) protein
VAHQFLAKPCDAETLKQTIDHASALRELLSSETLKQILSRLKSVPSMPALYDQLMEELQYRDTSLRRIGQIISQDPGMTAKILQLVNSAFFGLPCHVCSSAQATSLLGVDTIRALVLSIDVFSQFKSGTLEGISPEAVQKHSAETATLARQIAVTERASPEVADASLMAGFLHDVGKLILAQNLPEQYRQVAAHAQNRKVPFWQAERALLEATHAEVGAYLLGLWGLPASMVEATAFHHCPAKSSSQSFSALTAVHVANVLVHERTAIDDYGTTQELDLDHLTQIGLADQVPGWRAASQKIFDDGGNA